MWRTNWKVLRTDVLPKLWGNYTNENFTWSDRNFIRIIIMLMMTNSCFLKFSPWPGHLRHWRGMPRLPFRNSQFICRPWGTRESGMDIRFLKNFWNNIIDCKLASHHFIVYFFSTSAVNYTQYSIQNWSVYFHFLFSNVDWQAKIQSIN